MTRRATYLAVILIALAGLLFSCRKKPFSQMPQILAKVEKVISSSGDFIQYAYDAKGNVIRYTTQWKDATGNHSTQNVFDYNALNQLARWYNEEGYSLYAYQNGHLNRAEQFTKNGINVSTFHFTFNEKNQLTEIIEDISHPLPIGPIQTRINYHYFNSGNVSRVDFASRNQLTDPFQVNFSKKFERYDDRANPEPDGVLGAFLPGVKLQLNNPVLVETIAADGTIQGYSRYEYSYNAAGLPSQRKQYIALNGTEAQPLVFTYHYR